MSLRASEVISSVRATLDYPSYDKLKPQVVLMKLREKLDHYLNRLNLTDRDWFLDKWVLNAQLNQEYYLVSADSFGRPISCETQDLTDLSHIRRDVRLVDLQDRSLFYEGPVVAGITPTLVSPKHSAECLSFYRDANGLMVRITPVPSDSAEYLIWYEPNRPMPAILSSNLTFLDQFNNLLVVDLALTCLPYCDLDAIVLSEGYYKRRTKGDALREALTRDLQMYLATFEEYIQNDTQQRISVKQMWNARLVDY